MINIKNLTEKTLEIFVELESMRINVFLFLSKINETFKISHEKENSLSCSVIIDKSEKSAQEIIYEKIMNEILEFIEKNKDFDIKNIEKIIKNSLKNDNTNSIMKFENLLKIFEIFQKKIEFLNKQNQITFLIASNLEETILTQNRNHWEIINNYNNQSEKMKLEFERILREKEKLFKMKTEELIKDIKNIDKINQNMPNLLNNIKMIHENYNLLNHKLENVFYEGTQENIQTVNNYRKLHDLTQKKHERNRDVKQAFNRLISVAKEIQNTIKNFQIFMSNSQVLNEIFAEFFEFFDVNTDICQSDCENLFLFLKQLKFLFSEMFENINLGYLFIYQTITLEKVKLCHLCNKFFPFHNLKDSSEIKMLCSIHSACIACHKKHLKIIKKFQCFCSFN